MSHNPYENRSPGGLFGTGPRQPLGWRPPEGTDAEVQAAAQRETIARMQRSYPLTPLLAAAGMFCVSCGGPAFTRDQLAAMNDEACNEAIDEAAGLACSMCGVTR